MQVYPNKPIRIITTDAGTHLDMLARLIAQGISGPLGQPVIVENHPRIVPGQRVSEAMPDGHTLLFTGGNFWYAKLIKDLPYDPVGDFSPITLAATSPLMLVVHPSVAVNSVKELIALAEARPGKLSYASGLTGHSSQLAGALFTSMAGVNIVCIPCKDRGMDGIKDLIAGKVQLMIPSAGAVMPHVKRGSVQALAVTSAQPSALFPNLPTVAASGLPGYEIIQSLGIFAPAKTPITVIERLNQEIVRFIKTEEVKERFLNAGVEVVGSTPKEFADKVGAEMVKWGRVIKDAGVTGNN